MPTRPETEWWVSPLRRWYWRGRVNMPVLLRQIDVHSLSLHRQHASARWIPLYTHRGQRHSRDAHGIVIPLGHGPSRIRQVEAEQVVGRERLDLAGYGPEDRKHPEVPALVGVHQSGASKKGRGLVIHNHRPRTRLKMSQVRLVSAFSGRRSTASFFSAAVR